MKRHTRHLLGWSMITAGLALGTVGIASAADSETSAGIRTTRTGGSYGTATARYTGDVGFARTQTRTGAVTASRAVAVGVDEDGLSLSLSSAIGTSRGPAFGTNFNMTINRDGDIALSRGVATARGGLEREIEVGGTTSTRGTGSAISVARGVTRYGGVANARTYSENVTGRRAVIVPRSGRR